MAYEWDFQNLKILTVHTLETIAAILGFLLIDSIVTYFFEPGWVRTVIHGIESFMIVYAVASLAANLVVLLWKVGAWNRNGQGQPAGFTPDLMRKRLRLTRALSEVANDTIELELEDSDAKELVAALSCVRWQRWSEWLVDFCDAVEALAK